jgi:D-glucosaminate-6-phosphate ammonia-lyase
MTVYARLGVRTLVNARGCATLAGGTLMEPEVVAAMAEASRSFARIGDLQEVASERIAALTGAEAGYVTSGAAAGLTLGAAAILAGLDPDRMERLPETGDAPADIIVQATHRNPYDHLVRASGARLISFGDAAGGATVEQMTAAIGPGTAGAFFHGQAEAMGLPIDTFVATAHAHGLPVLVDASMNLPPRANLRRYTEAGADLVAFSGGKTIRGPQASGFLAGRADLVVSVGLQQQDMDVLAATWARRALVENGVIPRPPTHGIGRSMKTGKEEIVGLLVALERYADRDETAETARWTAVADRLAEGLAGIPGLSIRREARQADGRPVPMTIVTIDPGAYELPAVELVRRFATRDPIVMVGDHDVESNVLRLDPENLDTAGADEVIRAFRDGGS